MADLFIQITDADGNVLKGRRVRSRTLILDPITKQAKLDPKSNKPMTLKDWEHDVDCWPLESSEDKNGDPRLNAYVVVNLPDGGFASGNLNMGVKSKKSTVKIDDLSTEQLIAALKDKGIAVPQSE